MSAKVRMSNDVQSMESPCRKTDAITIAGHVMQEMQDAIVQIARSIFGSAVIGVVVADVELRYCAPANRSSARAADSFVHQCSPVELVSQAPLQRTLCNAMQSKTRHNTLQAQYSRA